MKWKFNCSGKFDLYTVFILSLWHSVVHRGITIERYNRTDDASPGRTSIWACATITLYQENRQYQMPMVTAQVHFRYPIVGKILFRQPRDDPLHDTTVIIE